jgi:hypothetical protein
MQGRRSGSSSALAPNPTLNPLGCKIEFARRR